MIIDFNKDYGNFPLKLKTGCCEICGTRYSNYERTNFVIISCAICQFVLSFSISFSFPNELVNVRIYDVDKKVSVDLNYQRFAIYTNGKYFNVQCKSYTPLDLTDVISVMKAKLNTIRLLQ